MAYSITLAHTRGMLNDAQRDEWFGLVSSVGLSMDHPLFTEELLTEATQAIKKTRDGKQRFAVPDGEFGKCVFLNDVTDEELHKVLRIHKKFISERYGSGEGKEAYVDAGDLGADPEAYVKGKDALTSNGNANGHANGYTDGPIGNFKVNKIETQPVKIAAAAA